MKRALFALGMLSVLELVGCVAHDPGADTDEEDLQGEVEEQELTPTGRAPVRELMDMTAESRARPESRAIGTSSAVNQFGIEYHNGPVMTQPIKLYFIWYGAWEQNARSILLDWANNVGGSPWWAINSTYTNASGTPVSTAVSLGGQIENNYSNGKSLSDSAIKSIVASALNKGQLPRDGDGIYFVLTAPDVTASSGFCSRYCGWHTYAPMGGATIKYSFVGNPQTKCLSSCSSQTMSSPNSTSGNNYAGVDAMVSILAHEAAETATDPQLNAWYDSANYENADRCAWRYGPMLSTAPNGSTYNVTLGPRNYLIQQNWSNVSPAGKCAMSYP